MSRSDLGEFLFNQPMVTYMDIPSFYHDSKGILKAWNPAFENFLGETVTIEAGKGLSDIFPKKFLDEYCKKDKSLLSQTQKSKKNLVDMEFVFYESPRKQVPVLVQKMPFFSPAGDVMGFVGCIFERLSEQDLRKESLEQELRYEKLFNSTRSGVVVYKPVDNGRDFLIVDFNRSAEKIDGKIKTDIVGKSLLEVFPGVEKFGLLEVLRRVVKTGQAEIHPMSFYTDQVLSGWRENYVYMLPTGEIVCLYDDLTEKKKFEEQLKKLKEELQIIIDSIPAMVFYKDRENRFVRVNMAFARAMSLPKEELEGKSAFDFYPREQSEKYWEDDKEVLSSELPKRNIIEPMETPQGLRWVQTDKIPYRDYNGEVTGIVGFAVDITARKETLEALRGSEQKFRSIVDNIGIGVALISPQMEILSLNKKMREWFPSINEYEHPICFKSFNNPPRDTLCDYCPTKKTLEDGLVHEAVTETPGEGKIINFRILSSPIKNSEGQITGAIELVEEITAQKELEGELVAKIRSLERFQRVTVDRELKMKELKLEIERLKGQLEKG